MLLLDLTLESPAENLALDDALLEAVDAGELPEVLRLWQAPEPMVVIGRSSKIAEEVQIDVCRERQIPVLRRSSGGAAVVAGPGCLMYACILHLDERPQLRELQQAHQFVMQHTCAAAQRFDASVSISGISDLALGDQRRKCSGNSMRYKRRSLLYHGTILYNFPLPMIVECLAFAPRQPDYRNGRTHDQFVANLAASENDLRLALADVWQAHEPLKDWPRERTAQLVEERYRRAEWHESR